MFLCSVCLFVCLLENELLGGMFGDFPVLSVVMETGLKRNRNQLTCVLLMISTIITFKHQILVIMDYSVPVVNRM